MVTRDLCYIEVVVGEGFPDNLSRLFTVKGENGHDEERE